VSRNENFQHVMMIKRVTWHPSSSAVIFFSEIIWPIGT